MRILVSGCSFPLASLPTPPRPPALSFFLLISPLGSRDNISAVVVTLPGAVISSSGGGVQGLRSKRAQDRAQAHGGGGSSGGGGGGVVSSSFDGSEK